MKNIPMASFQSYSSIPSMLIVSFVSLSLIVASGANFYHEVDVTWGDGRRKILNNGELLTLSFDKASGSGFQSKYEYLYGKIHMQLKLVPGNFAGTVAAYYLKSPESTWDEIDIEFFGIFFVDGSPIRGFKNSESIGVPFPKNQPMRIYSSLWNADYWATRGGLAKTDWSQAPFSASYRNFNADACV